MSLPAEAGHAGKGLDAQSRGHSAGGLGHLPGGLMETPADPQGPLSPSPQSRQGNTCHKPASCGLRPIKPRAASLGAQSHFSFIGFQNEQQNGS